MCSKFIFSCMNILVWACLRVHKNFKGIQKTLFFFINSIKICKTRPKYFFFSLNFHIGTPSIFLTFFLKHNGNYLTWVVGKLWLAIPEVVKISLVVLWFVMKKKLPYHCWRTKLQIFALFFECGVQILFQIEGQFVDR